MSHWLGDDCMLFSDSLEGYPPEALGRLEQCLEWILEMVTVDSPVLDDI